MAKIRKFIDILLASETSHVLVIMGPAGWAKTHTVREHLAQRELEYEILGSYSTALALYNQMARLNEVPVLVIDDTAGLLDNGQALSILNAASWPGADVGATRTVRWSSTSERVSKSAFDFAGKLILLTNYMARSPQAKAFINRALHFEIRIRPELVGTMLLEAARSGHYPDQRLAEAVAKFLAQECQYRDPAKISLRDLDRGVDMAKHAPNEWRELMADLLPQRAADDDVVREVTGSGRSVEDQVSEFRRRTGKSRRTFFYVRGRVMKSIATSLQRV